jgi:hypothetical protein
MGSRMRMRSPGAEAMLGALLCVTGCRGCDPVIDPAVVGVVGKIDGVDLTPYMAASRAILAHGAPAAAPSPVVPGHRVFVTVWVPGKGPVTATGLGATLYDSVKAASREVAKTASPEGRIELNVVTGATRSVVGAEMRDRVYDLGLHGYVGSNGAGGIGWILPSDILDQHRLSHAVHVRKGVKPSEDWILDGEALAKTLGERAGVPEEQVASMAMYRFDVRESLEARTAGAPPIPLYRTMPVHLDHVTPDELLRGVQAGAAYLARMTDENGLIEQDYDPVSGEKRRGVALLRHAEAIYAMLCAYEDDHDAALLDAAKRAIGYLKANFKTAGDGAYVGDGDAQQRVGGAGLALVALAEYTAATGDSSDLGPMRSLARFIVEAELADGQFRANVDVTPSGGLKAKKENGYYPGEGIAGLVKFYAIDPNPKWLAAAQKATDSLLKASDAKRTSRVQVPDHWLSYALHDLYVVTKDASYDEHAHKIALQIIGTVRKNDALPFPDYHGSFDEAGETTPTATRLEGLASTLQLTRYTAGDAKGILPVAEQLASFTLGQQLDADSDYFARFPDKAIGGVRESLDNSDIRIDYVQHSICAWLRLARLLRDPAYGTAPAP